MTWLLVFLFMLLVVLAMIPGLYRVEGQRKPQRREQAGGAGPASPWGGMTPGIGGDGTFGHVQVSPQAKQSAVKVRSQVC